MGRRVCPASLRGVRVAASSSSNRGTNPRIFRSTDVFAMSPAMEGDRIAPRLTGRQRMVPGKIAALQKGVPGASCGVLSATASIDLAMLASSAYSRRGSTETGASAAKPPTLPGARRDSARSACVKTLTSLARSWDRFRSRLCGVVRCQDDARDRPRARFWYAYGGKNREVLERLLGRFHRESASSFIDATFQGDYFEALAKLRTAIAARAAPALSHVVGEVVPYLAEAGVLEPLDGYDGASIARSSSPGSRSPKQLRGRRQETARRAPVQSLDADHVPEQAMLERAGVAPPTDWDELRAAAKKLTVRRAGRHAVWGFECPIAWWFWVALVGVRRAASWSTTPGRLTLGGESRACERSTSGRRWCIATASCDRRSGATTTPGRSPMQDFLGRPRGHDLVEHRVPALPRRERAIRGPRGAPTRRRPTRGADRRHVLRDAPQRRSAREEGRLGVPAVDGGAEANHRVGDEHRVHAGHARARSPSSRKPATTRPTRTIASRSISSTRSSPGRGRRRCFACSARSSSRAWKRRCSLAATRADALAEARREEP